MTENVKELNIFALAMDPVYIGTGGYTIGRVDNTIVRDPITNVPKIPGSSMAGTWRYYATLELISHLKEKLSSNLENILDGLEKNGVISEKEKEKIKNKKNELNFSSFNLLLKSIMKVLNGSSNEDLRTALSEAIKSLFSGNDWKDFEGNKFIKITCAGQDNLPQVELEKAPFAEKNRKTGHCGHCIVCKGFGFTKKDISWQGQIFFSDLSIILFPVFTMKGTKWITTERIINELDKTKKNESKETEDNNTVYRVYLKDDNEEKGHINLGWLYLPYKKGEREESKKVRKLLSRLGFDNLQLNTEDIVIVPEKLFSHIVNSNLEIRTSVSIDPITGAAKEGALFTYEAIPRGTIFHGKIRIFDKSVYQEIENRLQPLPNAKLLTDALNDSRHYYETLGIGGMTTRGFGRLKISELLTNGGSHE